MQSTNRSLLRTAFDEWRARHAQGRGLAWYLAAELCDRFYASHGIVPWTIVHEGLGYYGILLTDVQCAVHGHERRELGRLTMFGDVENWVTGGPGGDRLGLAERVEAGEPIEPMVAEAIRHLRLPAIPEKSHARCRHKRRGDSYRMVFRIATILAMSHEQMGVWNDPWNTGEVDPAGQAHPTKERPGRFLLQGPKAQVVIGGDGRVIEPEGQGSLWEAYMGGTSEAELVERVDGWLGFCQNSENETGTLEIGPQYAGDDPFTARMRFHQSWYRARRLRVPCGTGPTSGSQRHYGNMLSHKDGQAGLNFVVNDAHSAARRRLAEGHGVVEEHRLLHNLLSSQPMCFNLFGPMQADLEVARRFVRSLAASTGCTWPVRRVTAVLFEYTPEPKENYLNDGTAFDAFIEYEALDGTMGFIGIETKLTEPFSRGEPDTEAYRRWMDQDSPWLDPADPVVAASECNQLWRDHLLAAALLKRTRETGYARGCLLLVRHPLDEHCRKVAARYRERLKAGDDTFVEVTVADVVGAIVAAEEAGPGSGWASVLAVRYLALDLSEGEWQKRRSMGVEGGIK